MTDRKADKSNAPDLGLAGFHAPADEGLSLDQLNQAFAQMLGSGDDPYAPPVEKAAGEPAVSAVDEPPPEALEPDEAAPCEITPRSILEALLFVGHPGNEPLTSTQVAGLMRGVRPAEIDELVRDLNAEYSANRCPYTIISEGAGYRLALREEYAGIREKFYGRVRSSRLSPAAVEVLAIVAYNGPISADDVSRLRGTASGHILAQLVRRQLLAIERVQEPKRVTTYRTTKRFLEFFGLERIEDLPRSQELDKQ